MAKSRVVRSEATNHSIAIGLSRSFQGDIHIRPVMAAASLLLALGNILTGRLRCRSLIYFSTIYITGSCVLCTLNFIKFM